MEDLVLMDMWASIRQRPQMYIGDTNTYGLHWLGTEVIGLTLDEFRRGFCQQIVVMIHSDESPSIEDNGRPPTHSEASHFLNTLLERKEQATTERKLFTGFFRCGSLALVDAAALSVWFRCEIRDGVRRWQTRCEAPNNIRPDTWEDDGPCALGETGISFHFLPDSAIFGETTWDSGRLLRWLWEQVHLYPGVTITFTDEREGCEPQVLCAPDGLRELLPWCLEDKTPIHPTIITGSGTHEGMCVELALLFIEEAPTWRIYGCGIPLLDGGTPLTGLRSGFSRTLGKLASRSGISFQPDKARIGIAALVSVWTDNPQYAGPTKSRLANPEAEIAVAHVVRDALLTHARQHPDEMQAILAAL